MQWIIEMFEEEVKIKVSKYYLSRLVNELEESIDSESKLSNKDKQKLKKELKLEHLKKMIANAQTLDDIKKIENEFNELRKVMQKLNKKYK
jgi:vacuolar-type H+-ATPase subunit B/Vma2